MTALLASAVGIVIVKVDDDDDLSDPKSNTATALLDALELYTSAPLAVMLELEKDTSSKSINAVVPCVYTHWQGSRLQNCSRIRLPHNLKSMLWCWH